MPNHVTNVVTISGDKEQIKLLREKVQNDKYGPGTIDFNNVIPMPESVYRGDLGRAEREMYGSNNWYDWSYANWGTKWNAYGYAPDEDEFKDNEIWFLSAWAAAHPVICKLSEMYPDLTFTHEWVNEDYGSDCGRKVYVGGDVTEEYYPDTEDDILDFVSRVWNMDKEDLL